MSMKRVSLSIDFCIRFVLSLTKFLSSRIAAALKTRNIVGR